MAAFGAIMQFYDPLRSFPLWGFGDQVCASKLLHDACAQAQPQCALLVTRDSKVLAMAWLCLEHVFQTLMQGRNKCWALNGQQFQPEVKGLRGLLRTYRSVYRGAKCQASY